GVRLRGEARVLSQQLSCGVGLESVRPRVGRSRGRLPRGRSRRGIDRWRITPTKNSTHSSRRDSGAIAKASRIAVVVASNEVRTSPHAVGDGELTPFPPAGTTTGSVGTFVGTCVGETRAR